MNNKRKMKKKKKRDVMTSFLPPPDCSLYPELATMVDRRGISSENAQTGGQHGRQPHPQLGPCPLCKGNHWRSKCPSSPYRRQATSYGLMGPGTLSTLQFLALMLRSLGVAMMAEKQKIIF
jgi:hypothetical protein